MNSNVPHSAKNEALTVKPADPDSFPRQVRDALQTLPENVRQNFLAVLGTLPVLAAGNGRQMRPEQRQAVAETVRMVQEYGIRIGIVCEIWHLDRKIVERALEGSKALSVLEEAVLRIVEEELSSFLPFKEEKSTGLIHLSEDQQKVLVAYLRLHRKHCHSREAIINRCRYKLPSHTTVHRFLKLFGSQATSDLIPKLFESARQELHKD